MTQQWHPTASGAMAATGSGWRCRKRHQPVSPSAEGSRRKAGRPDRWSRPGVWHGRDALAARDFKWAAELADYVMANDSASPGAKRIKAQALIEVGERQINAIARNYYLTAAQYLLRDLPPQ